MEAMGMANIEDLDPGIDYQDTVALLQEEIARLEEELRLRDEARAMAPTLVSAEPAAPPPQSSQPADLERIAELASELARRDETIALLLEEIRLVEEAEAAGRAEWQQLNEWVEQVEQRVDSRDREEADLADELAAERRGTESLRETFATERQAWKVQRKAFEEEVKHLREQLAALAKQTNKQADSALAALESENRRLRQSCDDLSRAAASATEVETTRAELAKARARADEAQAKIRSLEDDIERERKEHEAALAALRSQLAREPLQRREGSAPAESAAASAAGTPGAASDPAAPAAARDYSQLSADERMSAFRQHLQEVHQREVEERSQNRLSARLSRLWRRTGPSGKPS